MDHLQNYYCIAGRLTGSVGVVCPNEPVIYECTVEAQRTAHRMELTFDNQSNSSHDLMLYGFHVHLTLVSVTATTITLMRIVLNSLGTSKMIRNIFCINRTAR